MQPSPSRFVDDLGDRLADCLRLSPALPVEAALPLLDAAQALSSFAKSGYVDLGDLLSLRAHLARAHRAGALRADDYADLLAMATEVSGLGTSNMTRRPAPRLRLLPVTGACAGLEPGTEPPVLQHGPLQLVVR
jgi:hypothetical protein